MGSVLERSLTPPILSADLFDVPAAEQRSEVPQRLGLRPAGRLDVFLSQRAAPEVDGDDVPRTDALLGVVGRGPDSPAGRVLKDRTSPYRDGSRSGWWKVKDRSWYEREAWRFDRR